MPGLGDCCAPFRMTHGPARGRQGRALASCNADLASSRIAADNVKGIFVIATEVHPRDLLQNVLRRGIVPHRTRSNLEQGQLFPAYAHQATDMTNVSIYSFAVNRDQRKAFTR